MMSNTEVEKIKYYGKKYPGSPPFDEATTRIQNKVKSYYQEHFKDISDYNNHDYEYIEKPLAQFLREIPSKEIQK